MKKIIAAVSLLVVANLAQAQIHNYSFTQGGRITNCTQVTTGSFTNVNCF